ncbi:hypothetical protein DPMN_168955 [Dreissena polymorpha]|uniref:Uncharacterized protein n=1 Tax=Dreissena polymorpha TaxID=45954 RepID=A0A9D4F2X3_DREPO|nr:hypothetical protein DPMN_168955 [Dreissena polymorpha]
MWFSKQGVVNLNALPSEKRSREFRVDDDSTGRKFIHQVTAESTKNHGIDDTPDDTTGEGKIYEQPGKKERGEMERKRERERERGERLSRYMSFGFSSAKRTGTVM